MPEQLTTPPLLSKGGYVGTNRSVIRGKIITNGFIAMWNVTTVERRPQDKRCKGKAIATGANTRPTVTCYDCGEKGHTRNYCPKKRDPQGEEARGRAYVIRDGKQQGQKCYGARVEANEELAQRLQAEERNNSKRAAEAELNHEGSKRQKTNEASGSNIQSLTERFTLKNLKNTERSSGLEATPVSSYSREYDYEEKPQESPNEMQYVPSAERVKISSTNVRLETTVHRKEETFQVVIDVIKNSTCFKAFTITAEVLEIFMQQFWYTIKKVKDSESYEFLLANKKCIVDAEVFRQILDICPRVKGEEFTEVQDDDDATLTFLIDLGYKGSLHKYTNMYVDHMHQPWRTLAAIINKCLSRKTIDHRKERKSRRETMTFSRFTKVIINHFLSQHKSLSKLQFQHYHTIKDDGIKSIGKGLQRKKAVDVSHETVDVFEESKPEPAKKRTGIEKPSKRQPGTRGSNEGTRVSPGVLDESTVIPATLSEGTGTKPGVPDEEKVTSEEKVILEWESEQESKYSKEDQGDDEEVDWIDSDEDEEKKDDDDDDKSIDLEKTDDEESDDEFVHSGGYVQNDDKETDDEFVQGDEKVNDDEDEEMINDKVEDYGKGDAEISDVAKADAKKIEEIKDDTKKAELPPMSSSLSVSSGFGDQFLKLSSDTSLVGTIKDTKNAEINSLLDIKIQSEGPHIQSLSVLTVPVLVISEPVLRVVKLEKDVSKLKKIDLSSKALATLNSQVPTVVDNYLGSKLESKKSASEIRKIKMEQAEKKKMPKYTIKSIDKASLKEYDLKSALYQTMHENKPFNRNLERLVGARELEMDYKLMTRTV
ncbi:retrovirus-related pol polyprotein from transposon TNT 1-94 [Tanacetum coccineum]